MLRILESIEVLLESYEETFENHIDGIELK